MEPFIALVLIALLGMAMPILLVLGALAIDLATLLYVAISVARDKPRRNLLPRVRIRIWQTTWHRIGATAAGL